MNLAKPRIDVGLFTNALEPMLVFWQEVVGLAFEETLPLVHGQRLTSGMDIENRLG